MCFGQTRRMLREVLARQAFFVEVMMTTQDMIDRLTRVSQDQKSVLEGQAAQMAEIGKLIRESLDDREELERLATEFESNTQIAVESTRALTAGTAAEEEFNASQMGE